MVARAGLLYYTGKYFLGHEEVCSNSENLKLNYVFDEGSAYCAVIMVFNLQMPAV